VLHFHAAGLSEIEARLPRLLRPIFRAAYGGADLAIQTSELNPPDGRRLAAHRTVIVANGVPDHPLARREPPDRAGSPPALLYVGILSESKGLLVLVEACRRLREHGIDFRLNLIGAFDSPGFELTLRGALTSAGIAERCTLLGPLAGDEKAEWFRHSDLFCYPTRFGAESFGIVLIEAMQFSLPVVATRWRGVPSVVEDGESGVLVPAGDPERLSEALKLLLTDQELRRRLGARGRELYLERFTEARYRHDMEAALSELASGR
jgi:glycosyltransferase involved in cell wall biosynthesis